MPARRLGLALSCVLALSAGPAVLLIWTVPLEPFETETLDDCVE
jgi:hypothetical protein